MPPSPPVEWFTGGIIERRKLEEYLLSPAHLDGKNKLRLWRSVFGIGEVDAELLEYLIRAYLPQAALEERKPTITWEEPPRMIRRWELVIPRFRGPNGNEGPVLTAWALVPGKDLPHLTTAYPLVR
ncbi:MAG: hypothetical protein H0U02_16285 [Rubrobacter sp.]|nr:hypothetical protein [Rubrobacter sp.]